MIGKNNCGGGEKLVDPCWSSASDETIISMIKAANAGRINLSDYWNIGDKRKIILPAMEAINISETHAEQEVTLVLLNKGGKTLTTGKECNYVVGLEDCLNETGCMDSSGAISGSWESSERRAWCNNEFKTAMLSTGIGAIFKQYYNITADGNKTTTNQTTEDWFALPAVKEIMGGTASSSGSESGNSNLTEFNALTQFSYYTEDWNLRKRQ